MLNFLTTTTVCGFSLYHVLAFFLIYSCTGWCLEVIFAAATTGQLVNRGFLNGPVCPIYGFGMVIVLFTLTPLQNSVLLLYIGGVILPSALELVGGWALYKLYHTRWWDYSDFPFNIGGYICLEFSLLWGVGTLVVMRIVHPVVAGLVDMVPPFVGFVVMCVLYAVYAADVVVTAFAASGLAKTLDAMEQLDQYIWESVCKTLHKWQESGSNLVPVSVNVSVVDIVNLDVPQIFSNLVEKYQLEPKLLLAEITETMLAENASLVENTIQGLHRKGFSVMMDDFGSGYSSLNMLKDTNVDAIKLDMKLIDMNQQNRSKGVQIVESVVDMAHRLNLPIIAEGVETPEQVSMLQAADCLYTQGYYFYKPMPVENAEALLAQPNSEDYWDMRRDLMRRDLMRHDRRVPVSDSEQTALALQAYQIFADNVLELSLLNLSTGEYRVIKRDPRLPGAGSDTEEDFAAYCERMVTNKVIHPDDAEMFTDQTDLETLRSAVFSTQQPEAYRFRKNVSGQFVWITMEFLPCRNCCAQNPWATVVVREDAQADHLSEELDFSYSHDTLTGLLNRSLFETDLRTLQSSEYDSMVCTYIDVVGLHEINNHLGHRSGDAMNQAEAAMRQDKQAYYARNGQERQLRGLNEKLEQTLTEKRDAEHFLRVLAPKYKSVFVVDLKTDRMRGVIVPDYFQKILDTSGGSFLAVLQQYRDTQVQPAYRESLADLLDYNYIRSKVLTGDIVEHTYKKTDDTTFRVKVTPYSRSGSHIDETLWIFSDEGASLTPPQTK